jgi:hypothetical protein
MRTTFALIACVLTACTAADADRPRETRHAARIEAAVPAGPTTDCVELNRIKSTQVLSDRIIDFEMRDGRVLRNVLPGSCPGLAFNEGFSYSTSLSRLCSVDIITVLERAGGLRRGASCGLGPFQPVTFPDRG